MGVTLDNRRITYSFTDSFVAGKILKRTSKLTLQNAQLRVKYLDYPKYPLDPYSNEKYYVETAPPFFETYPDQIIGKLTGKWSWGNGSLSELNLENFKTYEVELFNPVWTQQGALDYYVGIIVNATNDLLESDEYTLHADDGQLTGTVYKCHRDRGVYANYFPHHDPDYPSETVGSIKGCDYWDDYFGNIAWTGVNCPYYKYITYDEFARIPDQRRYDKRVWNGYDYKPERNVNAFEAYDYDNLKLFYNATIGTWLNTNRDVNGIAFLNNNAYIDVIPPWLGGYMYNYGFCYSETNTTPNIVDDTVVDYGLVGDVKNAMWFKINFINWISGLKPNTVYYIRMWETVWGNVSLGENVNQLYTKYSTVGYFSTNQLSTLPIPVIGSPAYNIATDSATFWNWHVGNLLNVKEWGVCWKAGTTAPTVSDSKATSLKENWNKGNTEQFTITGLSANTTYTFLPYAITADGAVHYCNPKNTIDGNCVQLNSAPTNVFTTKTGTKTLPSTELNSIFNKMVGSVGVQYKLTSNGNDKVTDFGICYSTSPNPTTSDSVVRDLTRHLEATVYIDITGLDPETEYYFRAFATNSVGTAYSNEKNEETVKDLVITTLTPTVTANNSVSCGGEITTESVITERGVCYGLYKNPTISNSTKLSETNTSGKYNVVISEGLTVNKTYYIKAYCKSGGQTYYGLESSFITNADTKPSLAVIETLQSPVVKTNTIDASVRVVNNGSSGIKELGAIVTITTNPTTLNTYVGKVTMNSGETKVISNLNDDTIYYLTAYAINNNDALSFGSSIEFTTLEVITQDFEVNYGANWDKTNKLLKLTILVDNENIDSYSFKYTTSYSNLISGTNLTVIESTNNVIDIDFKFLTQTTRIFGYAYATNDSAVECRNLYVIDLTLDVDGNVVVITDPTINTDKFNPPKNSPIGYVYILGSKKWIKTASGFERDYTYTGTDTQQVQSTEDLAFSEASATLDTPPVVEDVPVVVELFDTVDSKIVTPRLFEILNIPSENPPFETTGYQIDAYLNEVNKFYDGEPIKIVFGDYEISDITATYNDTDDYDIIIHLDVSRQNDISALNNAIQSQVNVIQIISTAISNTQLLVPKDNKKIRVEDIFGFENFQLVNY